jgi:hypothetical protein
MALILMAHGIIVSDYLASTQLIFPKQTDFMPHGMHAISLISQPLLHPWSDIIGAPGVEI